MNMNVRMVMISSKGNAIVMKKCSQGHLYCIPITILWSYKGSGLCFHQLFRQSHRGSAPGELSAHSGAPSSKPAGMHASISRPMSYVSHSGLHLVFIASFPNFIFSSSSL